MRAAFFGTPAAAVPSLAALATIAEVSLVVTRPDKPKGRSGRATPSPVKEAAVDWGFPIAQPTRVGDIAADVAALSIDVAVVTAFGRLLPNAVLAAARRGFVNVHFSLLPRWRGAAPVQHALLAGDETSGVSLMVLDEGLDTGPVFATAPTRLAVGETGGSLTARLAALGAELLSDRLAGYVDGALDPVAQNHDAATLAPKITVEHAHIDPSDAAEETERHIRAFHPRPGAWGYVDGERFKILSARPGASQASDPGQIHVDGRHPMLDVRDGTLELVTVQPAGKAPMSGAAWANGRQRRPARLT